MSDLERMYDLAFGIDEDGMVNLEQSSGCGEMAYITLHPAQLRLLAERAGLIGRPPKKSEQVADLERKLAVLDEKIADLVLNDGIRHEIVSRCGDGFEIILQMDGLLELSTEYTGGIQPVGRDISAPKAEGHDLSREVTTSHAPANDPKNGTTSTQAVPKTGQLSSTENGISISSQPETQAQPNENPSVSAAGEQLGLEV